MLAEEAAWAAALNAGSSEEEADAAARAATGEMHYGNQDIECGRQFRSDIGTHDTQRAVQVRKQA